MCLIFVSIYMVPRYKCWYDSDAAHSLILLLLCACIWSVKPTIFIFLFFNLLKVIQSREIFLFSFPSFFSSWTCFMSFSTKDWQSIILWAWRQKKLYQKAQLLLNFHNNFLALWASCCWDRLIRVGRKSVFFSV